MPRKKDRRSDNLKQMPGRFLIEAIQDGKPELIECGYRETDVFSRLIDLQHRQIPWKGIYFQTDHGGLIPHRLKQTSTGKVVLMQVFDK